jgi:DsbC/DsbD-like thiol-disulfide interchange protein
LDTDCKRPDLESFGLDPLAHDEFNGMRKVSPIHRAIMVLGMERLRPTAAACAVGVCVAVSSVAAAAEEASRWDGDARSAVRLLAGSASGGAAAPLRAGIEIRLKPGWHTYWRYPGEAGVPPRFEFAGSENLQAVDIRWPAPQRMPEQGLIVIGYARDVILPLVVVPRDRSKPVKLRVKLEYAVCEKLCVPAEGAAELVLPAARSSRDGALAGAEARVPKKVALGEGSALVIRSIRREQSMSRERIVVDLSAPAGTSVALFAEGPTPDWALPVPAPEEGAPAGLRRFAFDLEGAPPGAEYRGAFITLTAVAGEQAIEVSSRLD